MPREVTREVMGVLDEIAADAQDGALGRRNCRGDAERIVNLVRTAPKGREVIEYRAVGADRIDGECFIDEGDWTTHDEAAHELTDLVGLAETYLERRTVTYGEPERVEETTDAV